MNDILNPGEEVFEKKLKCSPMWFVIRYAAGLYDCERPDGSTAKFSRDEIETRAERNDRKAAEDEASKIEDDLMKGRPRNRPPLYPA